VSITPRGEGRRRRYQVRWREEGRQRAESFRTLEEARAFEGKVYQRRIAGAFAPAEPSDMRLSAWIESWWRRDSGNWSETYRRNRAGIIDRWISPYLGDVRLRDLGQTRVREWRAQLQREGASNNRVNVATTELSAILGAAARDGLVPFNSCRDIKRLPHRVEGHKAWPPIVFERLRSEMAPRDALMVSLMYLAGLRPEEALALTWGQVREHTLLIDRAAPLGKATVTKTGKAGTVTIVAPLAEDLAAARALAQARGLAGRGDQVIAASRGAGDIITLHYWREKIWDVARDATGMAEHPVPKDGRTSFGSLLIHEGRNVLEVSRQMRHARSDTTLRHYAHEFAEAELGSKVPVVDAVYAARDQAAKEKIARDKKAKK
jgi:integrase